MENTYVSGKQKFNDRVGEIIILKGDDHEDIKISHPERSLADRFQQ